MPVPNPSLPPASLPPPSLPPVPLKSLAVVLAALSLSHCTETEHPVDKALAQQELLFSIGTEIQGLDTHLVTGVPEHKVLLALCEGLVSYSPGGGQAEAGVAESWTVSDDGLIYTFRLRDNARWHNGDAVTARDFAWSWQRLLSPPLAAPFANMLYPVRGAEDYHRGKLQDFAEVGIEVLDDRTLRVELHSPTPYFLSVLTHNSLFPVHAATVLEHGAMTARNSAWARPGHFTCNGPFRLVEWRKDRHLLVEKAANYWDAARVQLQSIRFLPVDKVTTEERMFRTGQLHLTSSVPLERLQAWQGDPRFHTDPYLGVYYYGLNVTRPPLDDVRVRQALSLALDRQKIVDHITGGGEQIAHSFTPPQPALNYLPDTELEFNPEKARQLLAQAGYADGAGMRPLQVLYNTSEGHQKIAVAIQEMWRAHLKIEVTLFNQDWKVYLQSRNDLDYDIARAGWIADYEDPMSFLDIMLTGRGNNTTGWGNARFDRLVTQSTRLTGHERIEKMLQAEQLLMEELPVLPIYIYTNKYLLHPDVKGWQPNIRDIHPPKYLYLKRD